MVFPLSVEAARKSFSYGRQKTASETRQKKTIHLNMQTKFPDN